MNFPSLTDTLELPLGKRHGGRFRGFGENGADDAKTEGIMSNIEKIERVSSPLVAEPPPGRWSNALKVGNVLYTSGTVSRQKAGMPCEGKDEYEQAKIIFTKLRRLVEQAGGKMSDVVKMNIYMVNIKQNTEVWRARSEFFSGDFPVSTLVEVRNLATPETLVEIEIIAHIGAGPR